MPDQDSIPYESQGAIDESFKFNKTEGSIEESFKFGDGLDFDTSEKKDKDSVEDSFKFGDGLDFDQSGEFKQAP